MKNILYRFMEGQTHFNNACESESQCMLVLQTEIEIRAAEQSSSAGGHIYLRHL